LADLEIENEAGLVETMAGTATAYLLAHLTARFGEAIEEGLRDSDLMAQSVISASMALIFEKQGIDGTTDAIDEIEIAAQRVATMKRNLLRNHLKELPHMIVQRGVDSPHQERAPSVRKGLPDDEVQQLRMEKSGLYTRALVTISIFATL
jgi:hypothetical protein